MERYGNGYGTGMKKYGKVRKGMNKYGKVWNGMEKFGKVVKMCGKVWKKVGQAFGKVSKRYDKYGNVWKHMENAVGLERAHPVHGASRYQARARRRRAPQVGDPHDAPGAPRRPFPPYWT